MILMICLLLTILGLVFLRWKRRKILALYKQIPCGLTWLPILGHTYTLIGDSEHQMKALQMLAREATKRGGVVGAWHTYKLYILITDPVAAECVLKNALSKDDLVNVTHVLIGNGSLFAPVPIWRPRRKIVAPTFSLKNLKSFVKIFSQQSVMLTEQMKSVVGKGPVSMWQYLSTYTMDAVCESTLGVKVGAQRDPDSQIVKCIDTVLQLGAMRMTQPWLYSDFVFTKLPSYTTVIKCKKLLCGFVDEIIQEKRKSMKDIEIPNGVNGAQEGEDKGNLKTLIDLIIESSKKENPHGFSNLELREEAIVMFVAGTDTSAVGSAFTIVMLSRHPDVQKKVYQELQEVFGDSDRPLEAADLPRLKYLEIVIKETMRLYPPVPAIIRKVENDVTLPSGITLVEGCGVVIHIWGIHRNPQYWGEDVEKFRPERFIDAPPKHPAAFMPFSNGPRMCLGYQYAMMSMKTVIATIVRRYKVLPAHGDNLGDAETPLRVKFNIMMRDVDNYTVQLEFRSEPK